MTPSILLDLKLLDLQQIRKPCRIASILLVPCNFYEIRKLKNLLLPRLPRELQIL